MRVRDVAARLEVSAATVYSLVATGRLKCYRVGCGRGVLRISEEHLAEYLASCGPAVPPPPVPRTPHFRHLRLD